MVKVTFNSSLGQKEPKKECTDEALIPAEADVEDGLPVHRRQSRLWCWSLCLGLILSSVVVGGAYLYRSYMLQEDQVYFCGADYFEEDYMMEEIEVEEAGETARLRHIQETIRVLEEEAVELISVPVPEFSESDPADIVHDFNKRLTAYLDLTLNKCYIITLNTSIVMPPRDFQELLNNIKARTYLPQSYLVHEQMTVADKVDNMEELGYFIYSLCHGRDTYRLEPRAAILGIQKREVLNCRKIRHFENTFVVETQICEP
ncbi:integral membrane protein 2B-like [Lampris incognitus]|uniref:integral membrane protein 2B-like n=1 Tax=Lampris incognitus TaxID=2546036 RepID=UPI0024B5FBD3|nr:integral membrane protein 2B-like [Lampris incognitus]